MEDKLSPSIKIEIYQHDFMPGFACFSNNGTIKKNSKCHVAINIGSLLACVANKDIKRKDVPYFVAESIMHEVIHCLEAWAGNEFSEKNVEKLINKYSKKYRRVGDGR